ncbi:hypothetical protein [Streptomyces sp. A5-4]|uniref:hypothetical protein n=1 Tax=Streptomyces sp. A5-4 TaxID=3384771 RepID=UPI003DA7EAB6
MKAAELGRSRGGLTSKIHVAADRRCRPLAFVLTPGQAGDSPQFTPVLQQHGHHADPLPVRLVDPSELAAYVMHTTSTTG